MDYAIPRATQIPWLELDRTETPSPVNPLGVKGVGEAGTIGATPAIGRRDRRCAGAVWRDASGHAGEAGACLEHY